VEFYHIHTLADKTNVPNKHSDKWHVGNKFYLGEKKSTEINLLAERVLNPFINFGWEKKHIKELVTKQMNVYALQRKREIQADFFEKGLMFKYYQFAREIILEEIRKSQFKDKPSRLNSIWLTDKENLKKWLRLIPQKQFPQKVFVVSFTGKTHKADGRWITNPTLSFDKIYQNAIGYWSGKPKSNLSKPHDEFIGYGTIEILKEIIFKK